MKNLSLGRPLGAALTLGALLFAAAVAAGASWADLSAATEERDAKAELLQRGISAGRRAQLSSAATNADPFVPAESATLAAAAVDAELRNLASASGLALLSNRADAKPDESGAAPGSAGIGTRIEDQAVLEGQNEAVRILLMRLEDGAPTVLIDDFAIEPAEVAEGGGADPQSPRLRISVTLSAYWRPGQSARR